MEEVELSSLQHAARTSLSASPDLPAVQQSSSTLLQERSSQQAARIQLVADSHSGLQAPVVLRPTAMPAISLSNHSQAPAQHSDEALPATSHVASGMGGTETEGSRPEPLKKKRGRPRKYAEGASGDMSLALSSRPSSGTISSNSEKRRGRPPGSGRKQQLAAFGAWIAGSAGQGFTPHVITIAAGEDVSTRIMSFSQIGPRAVCVLSANGAISNVTLRQPDSSGGTVTYEGRFEILSLSGSFLLSEIGGTRSRTGGLSVSLAGPDGRVVGGGVAGLLVAASPVQVVVGSFVSEIRKSSAQIFSGAFDQATSLSPAASVPSPYQHSVLENPTSLSQRVHQAL